LASHRQPNRLRTGTVRLDRLTCYSRHSNIRRYQLTHRTFLRSKQTVSVAIDLLNRLTDHGIDVGELEQQHLDAWQATGPSTRLVADRFFGWAIKTRLVRPDLKIQRHRRGTSPRMSAVDQAQAVNRVVHADELTPRDVLQRSSSSSCLSVSREPVRTLAASAIRALPVAYSRLIDSRACQLREWMGSFVG